MKLAVRDLGAQFEQFSGHRVRIQIFEGPLDLLLHLVQREEIEASEIDLVRITEQFLRYLETMTCVNIQVAAEFIVTATSLLLLKSRSLLPQDEPDDEQIDEDDPAVELARRLAEYRTYKEAAEVLAEAQEARKQIYLRPVSSDDAAGAGVVPLQDVSVFDIVAAVQDMLERAEEPEPHTVEREEITVGERINQLCHDFNRRGGGQTYFDELVPERATRVFIVVTFLAVLEMIRRGELRVSQERPRGRISLQFVPTEEASQA
jgi:segregation and condensation protein A